MVGISHLWRYLTVGQSHPIRGGILAIRKIENLVILTKKQNKTKLWKTAKTDSNLWHFNINICKIKLTSLQNQTFTCLVTFLELSFNENLNNRWHCFILDHSTSIRARIHKSCPSHVLSVGWWRTTGTQSGVFMCGKQIFPVCSSMSS